MSSRMLFAFAIASVSVQASAATTVFDNATAFVGKVDVGYYLNTFTGSSTPSSADFFSYASPGFSYKICGAGGQGNCPGSASGRGFNTWINGAVVSNNYEGYSLHIHFDTNNVTALGGDFFGSPPAGGTFIPATMTITLSDGTSVSYAQTTIGDAFRGFISTMPIASLTLAAAPGRLNTIDNLIVGVASPVPEPSTYLMWLAGLLTVCATRRALGRR